MIGVDVGGTFTDVVSIENGQIKTTKISTDVHTTEQGVLAGAAEVAVDQAQVFNHASTHGLNAVITRRLPKIAFLTTEGHRDILDMGRTWRPAEGLMNPQWRRSYGDANRPLVDRYLRRGITERITADGGILIPLDEDSVRRELEVLRKCDIEGVAICLLNSYVNAHHEERLRQLVHEELGDIPVSISSEVSPLAKEFARASTTVIDVFMRLIYTDYSRRLDSGLRGLGFRGDLNFADCAAQLVHVDVAMEHPFRIVFAGPAAGTVSSAHFGSLIGASNLLCADVGGTSCDISLVSDGRPFVNTTFELEHDLLVNALSNEVNAIGAGGGSLVTINAAGELKVGPGSAGSDPGPACYGTGGTQPATTDTCLLMGVIDPDGFAGGRMKLDAELSRQAFENLDCALSFDQRVNYAFNIAINNIAEGLTNVAIQHGVDPRDFSLVAYGAAGPMLLPAALSLVHAAEVIVPPHPGLFSALGLVSTDLVYADSRSAYTLLTPEVAESVDKIFQSMEQKLSGQIRDDHRDRVEFQRSFDGRLAGQTWETPFIEVPAGTIDAEGVAQMVRNFHDTYEERAGNRFEALPVQGVTYRVQAIVKADKVEYPTIPSRADGESPEPTRSITIKYLTDEPLDGKEFERAHLLAGDRIEGPAVIREPLSTTFLVPGQVATVGKHAELRIREM
ncbi:MULTISPECIES: hydantoinase/oxoprolinase family protein [Rhodococcus]|uniref:hydantoinase/oxoprolinase family protein n=1 Tax=Rhodococcus globerulus TaxID=33008 RepID=UPI001C58FC8C|nr:hydantoinase/oxoprolinase family protein [Rhodococcus globerulus]QXW00470.1 hydantoinase/oxoprolinase family protein [Rhodococcus globerulus]